MARWVLRISLLVAVALGSVAFPVLQDHARAAEPVDGTGVVDSTQGIWYLRDDETGATTSFYYGDPGDEPFMGDWDCDGVDTPGLYRRSDGYVYLRNSNTQGIADISYYFGNPGDLALAGDFNGDGCDTVSLYRPSESRFYVINRIGSEDVGLGAAEADYPFGISGDRPFVGDFDGDGIDTLGLHRPGNGLVFLNNNQTTGGADEVFAFGDRADIVLAGSWRSESMVDSVGIYRPANGTFYLRYSNSPGAADEDHHYGGRVFLPIVGQFGDLPGTDTAPVNRPYLVSEYTTYHPAGEDRNININLIADMVDGAVVMPGAVFSLNDHVGERTIEKGFVPAGAIIRGQVYCCDHPANIGGGTSQFATTLYNAIFFGGYEDVYHRPHSLYFNRYPVVREATLSFPGPDVSFRNDTAFPVTIRTGHTATAITVQFWGDNEGRSVETTTVGSVTPAGGGEATVYRTIIFANGTRSTESWTHRYKAPIE